MLSTAKLVGFIPTTDYDKARSFYVDKLGFDFVSLDPYALVLRIGGHTIRVVKLPNHTPLQATILGWEVSDAKATVLWLKSRGIETEKYPWVPDKELGIWEPPSGAKVAWFKDPDSNVLSITQLG